MLHCKTLVQVLRWIKGIGILLMIKYFIAKIKMEKTVNLYITAPITMISHSF